MLDITFIRENTEKVKAGVAAKQLDPKIVDEVLKLDEKRRKLIVEAEELRAKRNKAAEGKDIEEGKKIKEELKKVEPALSKAEEEFKKAINEIPNLPADDVKEGKDERENEILRKEGKIKKFDFEPKDHLAIGEALGILDIE